MTLLIGITVCHVYNVNSDANDEVESQEYEYVSGIGIYIG